MDKVRQHRALPQNTHDFSKSAHQLRLEELLGEILQELKLLNKTSSTSTLPGAKATFNNVATAAAQVTKAAQVTRSVRDHKSRYVPQPKVGSEVPLDNKLVSRYEFLPWLVRDFCREYRGRTVTCRAIADYGATLFKRTTITEAQLKEISKKYPDLFKVVKTDDYEDSVVVGNEIVIQPNENPNRKRLSAVRIY